MQMDRGKQPSKTTKLMKKTLVAIVWLPNINYPLINTLSKWLKNL